jgi:hypothetical protein
VVTWNASLSPVVEYHGLGHRHLKRRGLLMRPQLNGGTLGSQDDDKVLRRGAIYWGRVEQVTGRVESSADEVGVSGREMHAAAIALAVVSAVAP